MADKRSDKKTIETPAAEPRKKADVILEKIDCLLSSSNELVNRVDKSVASTNYISRQNSEIYERTLEENANIRQQIKYIAAQNQNVFDKLSAIISELSMKVSALEKAVEAGLGEVNKNVENSAGEIGAAVEKLAADKPAAVDYEAVAEAVAARIDLEELAKEVSDKLAESITVEESAEPAAEAVVYEAEEITAADAEEDEPYGIDYDLIADKVAERLVRSVLKTDEDGEPTGGVREDVSADYIAARVAEQIIIPDPDYDAIADAVFEKFYQDDETPEAEEADEDDDGFEDGIVEEDYVPSDDELKEFAADEEALPEYEPVDYEKIASLVVEKLVESDEEYESGADFDYEKLADLVAERLFRDDGTGGELDEEETFELDYDKLAEAIVAKGGVAAGYEEPADAEGFEEVVEDVAELDPEDEEAEEYGEEADESEPFDYEKLADLVAARLGVAAAPAEASEHGEPVTLAEETMAQIVDEISKRVCEFLPEEYDIVVDDEGCAALAEAISEKLPKAEEPDTAESAGEEEYDIVIDEEGVAEISDGVAAKVIAATESRIGETEGKLAAFEQSAGERFDKIESDVSEIKELIQSGAVIAAGEFAAAEAAAEAPEEDSGVAGEPEDEDGGLVTVSDLIGDDIESPETTESAESVESIENVEGVEEAEGEADAESLVEFIEEPETDVVIEEIVSDIDEQPVEGEVMPDGMDGEASAVDFANMMKYNRSFIARIIQGSDEVKTYYGQTKTALLSYKKVNSSVAWGAERFNKGRETIAKFKIRGKTLCLYLALDPKEYPVSVYHQVDVSDNKSMATTPMMVKIKSPRGVKKAIRLIDEMLVKRGAVKQNVVERDYVAMYPYETIEELIEDGLVKDVSKNK